MFKKINFYSEAYILPFEVQLEVALKQVEDINVQLCEFLWLSLFVYFELELVVNLIVLFKI